MSAAEDGLLMLSLKPRFAGAILDGSKTIELRRKPPRTDCPTKALLYASSPTMALAGTCWVDDVVALAPWTMWRTYGPTTGVTRREFLSYFEGCTTVYGLLLSQPERLAPPVRLEQMREALGSFQPPQSFWYTPKDFLDRFVAR